MNTIRQQLNWPMGIIIALLIPITAGQSVNFTDCGDGNVNEVRIYPCSTTGGSTACTIKLGTNVTVEADFVATFNTDKLFEVIKGVVRGREMPFPEQRADPCTSGKIFPSCPIKKGEHYQFKAWFEVKPFYPPMTIKVRHTLTDAAGQKLVCIQVATKIIDSNSKNNHRSKSRSKSNKNNNVKPKN